MKRHVSKNSTETGEAIWESVKKAANQTPEWVRGNVEKASRETVERIVEKSRDPQKSD